MKTYIDYCPNAPVSINAELITVPSGPPYVVETEHNWIVNDSSIEIWENDDKSGTHLVEEAYDGSVSGSGKFQVDYLGASEGDAKYCNKIFFHADQGGLSFYVWYKTEGDIFGADDANSKALKDSDAVEGNLAEFDANGNPVDSGVKPVDLALKDSDAVENNLAKFDSSGNPVDSGIAISDVSKNLYIVENPQTGTTYTLVLTDGHKLVSCTNNDPIALTIPLNSNVAFPIGTQILIVQKGTGQITIGGDSNGTSVTVLSAGSVDTTVEQYSMAGLIKVDTDDWILFGDLE